MPKDNKKSPEARKEERAKNYPNLRPRPERDGRVIVTPENREGWESAERALERECSNQEVRMRRSVRSDSIADVPQETEASVEAPLASSDIGPDTEMTPQDIKTPENKPNDSNEINLQPTPAENSTIPIINLPGGDHEDANIPQKVLDCDNKHTAEKVDDPPTNTSTTSNNQSTSSSNILQEDNAASSYYDELNALAAAVASTDTTSGSENIETSTMNQPKADDNQ